MQLRIEDADQTQVKTVWMLIAVALNALEYFIPRVPFLPWLKPGFANCITMLWIMRYGFTDALIYTVLRTWISGFYFGFSLLTMGLALSGGILSTAVMALLWISLGKRGWIGTVSIGITGALFHNTGQLLAVYGMMARNSYLFYQVPFMLAASIITGGSIGLIVPRIGGLLLHCERKEPNSSNKTPAPQSTTFHRFPSLRTTAGALAVVAVSILLLFTGDIRLLAAAALAITLTVQVASGFSMQQLFYPLRFWLFFLFVILMYLPFSYGTRIDSIPMVTREGVHEAAAQSLRLWCWLQSSFLLRRFRFHDILFAGLERIFPRHGATLAAGMLALQHFPLVARLSRTTRSNFPSLVKHPVRALHGCIDGCYDRVHSIAAQDG
jgi:heptaprenyl diphosphate synthase